ncbi:hypothetical protein Srubr_46480 [Streptomyces rubradiris]|uniref:FHA domain-containing protein n=1 Tax=Streptomyces rubradiris TaxID=285531 RepID=A0ABQ3RG13_STRRR|nr:hypothetical protein GCM10018792_53620 [Streptomyces rubradiris]GHI54802.1 hypothetical protein Srubr_46480 [Streptomyces rubradiris]
MCLDLWRLPPGQNAVPFRVGERRLGFDLHDVGSQSVSSHHVSLRDSRGRYLAIPIRYVWPAELDLMARLQDAAAGAVGPNVTRTATGVRRTASPLSGRDARLTLQAPGSPLADPKNLA